MMGLEFGIWCSFSRGPYCQVLMFSFLGANDLVLKMIFHSGTGPYHHPRVHSPDKSRRRGSPCHSNLHYTAIPTKCCLLKHLGRHWENCTFLNVAIILGIVWKTSVSSSVKPILFVQTIPSTIRMVSFNHFSFCFWRSHLLCHPSCRHSPCHTLPQKSPNFIISPLPFCEGSCISHPAGMFESMMILQASRFGGICDSFPAG